MKQCNETITVINRRLDSETGLDVWIPTVIRGVSWHSSQIAAVTQSGLKAANTVTVRVPADADTCEKVYAEPAAYKAAADASGLFTFAEGDLIVRAAIPALTLTPAELHKAYDDCYTVTGATNNTRRPRGAHWKVVGA